MFKKTLFIAVASIALIVVVSLPAMLLWNYALVPAIVGLSEVTWLQMIGINVLLNLLFKTSVEAKL